MPLEAGRYQELAYVNVGQLMVSISLRCEALSSSVEAGGETSK
jgi:hypothetical protein